MTTVANAGEVQLGKMRSPASHSGPNIRPYLRVANVLENKIDITDVHEMNFTPDEFEKFRLISGDVLLNEGQSPNLVGRPAMFRGEIDDCCFQKTLLRFRSNDGVSPTFALLVFRHYLHSGRFRQAARWSTNIAHLTAVRFGAIEFPQVPLVEQEAIVEEATRRLDMAAELKDMFDDILSRASIARDLVLAEAFHVEPGPNAAWISVTLRALHCRRNQNRREDTCLHLAQAQAEEHDSRFWKSSNKQADLRLAHSSHKLASQRAWSMSSTKNSGTSCNPGE